MESPQTFIYPFYQISQDFGKVFIRLLLFHNVVRWLWQAVCLYLLAPTNFCTHFLLCIKFARDIFNINVKNTNCLEIPEIWILVKGEIEVSGLLQGSHNRGFWQLPAGEGRQDQPIRALFFGASPCLPSCLVPAPQGAGGKGGVRAQDDEIRPDKLFFEQQARMGNSLTRQEKGSQNIPAVVCSRRAGDKGQSVKLVERVCWELGVWLALKTWYQLLQPQNVAELGLLRSLPWSVSLRLYI